MNLPTARVHKHRPMADRVPGVGIAVTVFLNPVRHRGGAYVR
jgi:hypothetical protein